MKSAVQGKYSLYCRLACCCSFSLKWILWAVFKSLFLHLSLQKGLNGRARAAKHILCVKLIMTGRKKIT